MDPESVLKEAGIHPTAARVMIFRELGQASCPMSMQEIGDALETVDKSVISRTLALFREHHLVHMLEDGSESTRYELCTSRGDSQEDEDAHVHFHCEVCGRTFCFEDVAVPSVEYPSGFEVHYLNYMAKGICPECRKR